MKKFTKLAVVAALAALSFASHANVLIDDFSVNGYVEDKVTDANGAWTSNAVSSNTIIGGIQHGIGFRDMFVQKTSNVANDPNRGVNMDVSGGTLSYNQDSGQSGIGLIRWDGSNTSSTLDAIGLRNGGLTGIDLTDGGNALGFNIFVVSADAGFDFQLQAYTNGTDYSILQLTSLAGPNVYFIPFAAFGFGFVSGAGADFTNIGALQVVINPLGVVPDLDMSITMAETPEPGTMALAGLALLSLGMIRRRSMKK